MEFSMFETIFETAQILAMSVNAIADRIVGSGELAGLPKLRPGLVFMILPFLAITLGILVFTSFFVTRFIRKIL